MYKGVHSYARYLDELQIKLTDNRVIEAITDEVTIRKFIIHIPTRIWDAVTPQLQDNMNFTNIETLAETYEAANKGIDHNPAPALRPK